MCGSTKWPGGGMDEGLVGEMWSVDDVCCFECKCRDCLYDSLQYEYIIVLELLTNLIAA